MPNYNNGGKAPKEEKINEWRGTGTVHPRSGNDNDEIRFFPFQKGGGAIHFTLVCKEPAQGADENGNPRMKTTYIPVNVMTNKLITQQQLQSIRSGMLVRVVGKLEAESYTSNKDGKRKTALVVNAFVFEVLSMPAQIAAPQYQQGGYPAPGQYGAQPQAYPPQAGYPGPQGGYSAPGQYVPQPQAYPPQTGYPGPQQPAAPQGGAPARPSVPPYYTPPQTPGAPAQGPAPAAGGQYPSGTVVEDLP